MANEIRLQSNLLAVKEVDVTEGGNTYDKSAVDTNAGRSFGGKYNTLTAYTDGDIARWSDAVITATSYDGINDSGWTELSDVTDGTLPTTCYAFAVEYIKELGTVGTVDIELDLGTDQIVLAALDLGEAISIPAAGGLSLDKIKIKAGAYSNGVNEATVNVLVMGT